MADLSRPKASEERVELFWGYADALLRAGEQLAEKLAEIDSSPWTIQILEEWQEAKELRA